MPKIQIKRGSKAKLPTLAPGEFGPVSYTHLTLPTILLV